MIIIKIIMVSDLMCLLATLLLGAYKLYLLINIILLLYLIYKSPKYSLIIGCYMIVLVIIFYIVGLVI